MAKSDRNWKFELGDRVKDKITSFTGILVGRGEWLYGCPWYTLQPEDLDKEGKVKGTRTFDEDRLELVMSVHQDTKVSTGGSVSEPPAIAR